MHALSLPDDRSLSDSLVVFFPANNIPKQHLARVGTTHHTDRQSFHLVSVICKWAVSRATYSTTYATGRDLPCSTDLLMLTHLPNSLSKRGRSTTQKTPRHLWISPDGTLRFDWNEDGRFASGGDFSSSSREALVPVAYDYIYVLWNHRIVAGTRHKLGPRQCFLFLFRLQSC